MMASDLLAGLNSMPAFSVSSSVFQDSRILVRFQGDAGQNALHQGTRLGRQVASVPNLHEIDLDQGTTVDAALAAYRQDPNVLYAEPDSRVFVDLIPNDPRFSSLWALNNTGQSGGLNDADIDASEAWDASANLASITVAVIDTGIDFNHPDLKANMWVNTAEIAGNRIDDDRNGYVDDIHGWDFANRDSSPLDDNGHGTHVAGTIGAIANNGIGVAGVAANAKLMALKFLDSEGGGYLSDAIAAIDYAARNGAKIANNSWGGGAFSQALSDAIERYRQSGGVFIAAAGNEGSNNDVVASYPANFSHNNIISVAASDASDKLASFSNYGVTKVDIAAPGVNILSTTPNNTYSTFNGTSMATPHVSGAAAVVWGKNPTWTYAQVIDRVLQSADPILKEKVAAGRLNLNTSVGSLIDNSGPRVTSATWYGGNSTTLNRIRITFDEPINSSTLTVADISVKHPNGTAVPITAVKAASSTEFDITFANQSAAGVYSLTVGPNIADLAGNLMNQDRDAVMAEATQDRFSASHSLNQTHTFTWNGNVRIYDNWVSAVYMDLGTDVTIADLNVRVSISHTYDSDLRVYVVDPSGVSAQLFNRRGGSGDNIYATFDDEASTLVRNGRAPFNGSFVPETPLSVFDGKRTAGRWAVYVEDVLSWYTGSITSVSLIVQSAATVGSPATASGAASVRMAQAAQMLSNSPGQTIHFELDAKSPKLNQAVSAKLLAIEPEVAHAMGQAIQAVSASQVSMTNLSKKLSASKVDELFASGEHSLAALFDSGLVR